MSCVGCGLFLRWGWVLKNLDGCYCCFPSSCLYFQLLPWLIGHIIIYLFMLSCMSEILCLIAGSISAKVRSESTRWTAGSSSFTSSGYFASSIFEFFYVASPSKVFL